MNSEETFGLIKYLLLNGQYIHLNNYCLATKWIQKGKSLRYFLLGNCCLFFNNIDQSIDLFLKASHFINNDQLLKKLMKLTGLDTDSDSMNMSDKSSINVNNRRKSINITKASTSHFQSQMDSSIFNNTSNIEIFDKLLGGQNPAGNNRNDEDMTGVTEKMLLTYYIKIIHYYDLNGDIEAAIELVQNALLMFQFDTKTLEQYV